MVQLHERIKTTTLSYAPLPPRLCSPRQAQQLHDACLVNLSMGYLPQISPACLISIQVLNPCLKQEFRPRDVLAPSLHLTGAALRPNVGQGARFGTQAHWRGAYSPAPLQHRARGPANQEPQALRDNSIQHVQKAEAACLRSTVTHKVHITVSIKHGETQLCRQLCIVLSCDQSSLSSKATRTDVASFIRYKWKHRQRSLAFILQCYTPFYHSLLPTTRYATFPPHRDISWGCTELVGLR